MFKMKKTIVLFLALVSLKACKEASKTAETETFEIGQVWSYQNRVGEDDSTLQILEIDEFKEEGKVYHIAINDLKLKNPANPDGLSKRIGHIPISKLALKGSIVGLLESNKVLPSFKTEYSNWKTAFLSQKGGVFETSVKETVVFIEQSLNNR